jgi:3-deoxy-D-manno-octulosonate 8-phosphate phosphatase (KDO 8-P phosphatase)
MKIKMLVMDVDGTLTDGHIYMSAAGEAMKAFHSQDGYGIAQILPKLGIMPVIITGRTSQIVANRAAELKITRLYQGASDKLPLLQTVAAELGVCAEEIAYIGDDLNDLTCMQYCGLTGCPADAVPEIRETVNFVSSRNGGQGAVREFIDMIQKQYDES